MDQADALAEDLAQHAVALGRGGEVDRLGFLDQRADPVDAGAARDRALQAVGDLVAGARAARRGCRSAGGRPASRSGARRRVAIGGQHQGARDRRRGHHQQVDAGALVGQRQALLRRRSGAARRPRRGADRRRPHPPAPAHGCRRPASARPPPGRASDRVARLALVAAGEQRDLACPAACSSGSMVAKCWRARISVGASSAAWPPASTAFSIASSATTVLPLPTSPCSRRSMRVRLGHVGVDLGQRLLLRTGQGEGQGRRCALRAARRCPCWSARPCACCAGARAPAPAGWPAARHRRGAARRRQGRELAVALRMMGGAQRVAPSRAIAAACRMAGSIHSGSSGSRSSAASHRLAQRPSAAGRRSADRPARRSGSWRALPPARYGRDGPFAARRRSARPGR